MSEIQPIQHSPTRDDIARLQAELIKMPQAELITRHYFADGMYCRELWRPAGCLIVGKVHKKEHFYIIVQGEVTITQEGMIPQRIKAPKVIVSPVGTKRAVFAHEDSVCVTVHRTESRDLEEIEDDLVEYDPTSLYGPGNLPIALEEK